MTLMPVAQVKERILHGVVPLESEAISISDAGNRVLAEDLKSKLTQPPFDASAMDGYAVRACDIEAVPVRLRVIGRSAAGHGFVGAVGRRDAVRIFTGAPVPPGADTIVIQENTRSGDGVAVEILEQTPRGKHIRLKGYDFEAGSVLLPRGTKLSSRHLMLAAAMNHAVLPLRRKPVIAVLANGDELVRPGCTPAPGQIVSSIPAALNTAISSWGGEPLILDIARDSKESIAERAGEGGSADVLLTIGGASVGDHDLVRGVLEEAGVKFQVLKAAMRPGKPLMFGLKGMQRVLSLPGNPVSAVICARVFLKPLIERFLGLPAQEVLQEMPLSRAIEANGEREHYMRAQFSDDGVAPIADQDSSLMKVFAASDCLIVRPIQAPALQKGDVVPVILLDF
jgi:molybdopterin molybdotransferase